MRPGRGRQDYASFWSLRCNIAASTYKYNSANSTSCTYQSPSIGSSRQQAHARRRQAPLLRQYNRKETINDETHWQGQPEPHPARFRAARCTQSRQRPGGDRECPGQGDRRHAAIGGGARLAQQRQDRARHRRAGRPDQHQGHAVGRPARTGQAAANARPVIQFHLDLHQRRHRHHPPGHPARPRARPAAGAGQRQAPPPAGAGQRPADHRARLGRHRHQCDSAVGDPPHRGAARRRRRPIRLGRDRRRDQHRPQVANQRDAIERHRRHHLQGRRRPVSPAAPTPASRWAPTAAS